jgi:hypothetical protein
MFLPRSLHHTYILRRLTAEAQPPKAKPLLGHRDGQGFCQSRNIGATEASGSSPE